MEPNLAQIKEYLMEKGIDIFNNISRENDNSFNLFGDNQIEAYYQYYLEHSTEICEWLNNNLENRDMIASLR